MPFLEILDVDKIIRVQNDLIGPIQNILALRIGIVNNEFQRQFHEIFFIKRVGRVIDDADIRLSLYRAFPDFLLFNKERQHRNSTSD
jgi:hypothetical protein